MPARSRIILPLAIPDKAGMVLAEMCPVQWANITLLSRRCSSMAVRFHCIPKPYCKRHTFYYHGLIFLRLTTEALMSTIIMVESTFGTEELRKQNAEVYHTLSTHSYTDTAHIKLITLSCSANIKHLSLSFQETVPRQCLKYTKADSELKGFQEMTIQ